MGKRVLVKACLMLGVSISRIALEAGINANQLHEWIRSGQRSSLLAVALWFEAAPAFTPVLQIDSAPAQDQKR